MKQTQHSRPVSTVRNRIMPPVGTLYMHIQQKGRFVAESFLQFIPESIVGILHCKPVRCEKNVPWKVVCGRVVGVQAPIGVHSLNPVSLNVPNRHDRQFRWINHQRWRVASWENLVDKPVVNQGVLMVEAHFLISDV